MTLLAPSVGDILGLKYLFNYSSPDNAVLHLYSNNYTPVKGSIVSSFTECTGTGYAAVTLTGSSWTFATVSTVSTASYPQQTFTWSASDTVYGYYLTNNAGTTVLLAELFSNGPFNVVSGSEVLVSINVVLS